MTASSAQSRLPLSICSKLIRYCSLSFAFLLKIALLRMVLEQYGFDPKRLKLEWVSASEGEKFQKTIVEFVDTIKELGPTPLKGDE